VHIDLQTVRRVFEDVLSGSISREQADRWAFAVVLQEEAGVATYSPAHERDRIWAGVMYLYGIDTMKAPGQYLHPDTDIRAAMDAKLGEVADSECLNGPPPASVATLGQRDEFRPREQHRRLAVLDVNLPA
jgi:hypothetical protein